MNIEIMRNTLYKAYLDDFAQFCNSAGGATAEVMGDLLAFEVSTHARTGRSLQPGTDSQHKDRLRHTPALFNIVFTHGHLYTPDILHAFQQGPPHQRSSDSRGAQVLIFETTHRHAVMFVVAGHDADKDL